MTAVADQRMSHLREANEVRTRRSRLKVEMAKGSPTLADVLLADKQWMRTMKVRDVLGAVPGLGGKRVDRALRANQIAPFVKLANFPMPRRYALLCWLAAHHPKVEIGEPRNQPDPAEREAFPVSNGGYR